MNPPTEWITCFDCNYGPSPLFSIFITILSVLFFYTIDYLILYLDKKGKYLYSIIIIGVVGTFTFIWLHYAGKGPFPFFPSRNFEIISFLFDRYITGFAIYALLDIPYLIYQYIKKRTGKRITIIKIVVLLILLFLIIRNSLNDLPINL